MYHATLKILGKIENMQVLFLSVLLPLTSKGQPGDDIKSWDNSVGTNVSFTCDRLHIDDPEVD